MCRRERRAPSVRKRIAVKSGGGVQLGNRLAGLFTHGIRMNISVDRSDLLSSGSSGDFELVWPLCSEMFGDNEAMVITDGKTFWVSEALDVPMAPNRAHVQ